MVAATQTKQPRRVRRCQPLNFTTSNLHQSLSNRNNASFKIPANSMKINAKPNSNRNTDSALALVFTNHRSPATNHNSQLTIPTNSRYNQASICASPQSNRRTSRAIIEAPKGKVA